MSFYILMKGNLVNYEFDYLDPQNSDNKWEKTKPHKQSMNDYLLENKDRRSKSKDLYANEFMSRPVNFLELDSLLPEAKKLMDNSGVRHIPITRDGKPVGIISDRDLLRLEKTGTFAYITLEEVMSSLVICTLSTTPLSKVAEVFVKEQINAMPVIDDDLQIIGIISSRDILNAVVNHRFLKR